MKKNRKKQKGFSLVELIVVIAVMAVLVVVLAPAYLRYVDKARLQKDISAISEVAEAIKVAAAEQEVVDEILAQTGAVEGNKSWTYAEVIIDAEDGTISANTVITAGGFDTLTGSQPAPNLLREVTATVGEKIELKRDEFHEKDVVLTIVKTETYNVSVTVNARDFRTYEDVYVALQPLGETAISEENIYDDWVAQVEEWKSKNLCALCGGSFTTYEESGGCGNTVTVTKCTSCNVPKTY